MGIIKWIYFLLPWIPLGEVTQGCGPIVVNVIYFFTMRISLFAFFSNISFCQDNFWPFKGQFTFNWKVWHIDGKFFSRAITLSSMVCEVDSIWRNYQLKIMRFITLKFWYFHLVIPLIFHFDVALVPSYNTL